MRPIIKGSKKDFQYLYETYKGLVFWIAYSYLKNKEEAEDILQDTFISFFNSYDNEKFKTENDIKNYLAMSSKNKSLNLINQRRYGPSVEEVYDLGNNDTSSIEIQRLKEILDEEEYQILTLKIVYELTFKEIGNIIDKTEDSVSSKYKRIKDKLKEGALWKRIN